MNIQETIIGTLFSFPDSIKIVAANVKPEYFDGDLRKIYEAIIELHQSGKTFDHISVFNHLKTIPAKSIAKLIHYTDAHIEQHCKILVEESIRRDLKKIANKVIKESANKDISEIVENIQKEVYDITMRGKSDYKSMVAALHSNLEALEERRRGTENTIIHTGLYELDDKLGGLKNGELYIIAARPSMGKSSLALRIGLNIADKYNVLFLSLEMSTEQLVNKIISIYSKVPLYKILSGKLSTEETRRISEESTKLLKVKMIFDDAPNQNIADIRSKCYKLKLFQDIRLIIVDYLQLCVASKSESREREVSLISQSLKGIAKELNVPVIALSQLNRNLELRKNRRPQLSDLRESGAIEQDSDVVLFLYRDDYYGIDKDENDNSTENIAELIIAKNRLGATGTIKLYFDKEYADFKNLADQNQLIAYRDII